LLVLDRDGNGSIDHGGELFGTNTVNASGETAAEGFDALAALDSNGDGVVSAADAGFAQLQVWVDDNQDGVSQASELLSLGQLNITALNLDFVMGQDVQNNNPLALLGSYTTADGQSHEMTDVLFQVDHEQTASLQAADLLQPEAGLDTVLGEAKVVADAAPAAPDVAVDLAAARLHVGYHHDMLVEQAHF